MKEQLSKSQLKQRIIDAAIEEYINTPKFEKSATRIAAQYGINRKTLLRHLKNRNIEIITTHGANSINENVFNKIDTEEKAY
jgi:hypothetical protein